MLSICNRLCRKWLLRKITTSCLFPLPCIVWYCQVVWARLCAGTATRTQCQWELETHDPRSALRRRSQRQLARIRLQLPRSTVGGKSSANPLKI